MPLVWDLPGEDPTQPPTPTPALAPAEPSPTPSSSTPAGKVVWDLPGPDPLQQPEQPGVLDQLQQVAGYVGRSIANPFQAGADIVQNPRQAAALTARVAPPIVGSVVGGVPGAVAGGAGGEALAQLIEGREHFSPGEIAVGGAIGAVPAISTARMGLPAALAMRTLEGGIVGAGQEAGRQYVRGEELNPTQIAGAGLVGAPIGGITGGALSLAARSNTLRSILEARRLAGEPEAPAPAAAPRLPRGGQFGMLVDDLGIGIGTPLAEMQQPAPRPQAPQDFIFHPTAGAMEPAKPAPGPRQGPQAAPAAPEPPIRSQADQAASPEALNRLPAEESQGVTYERVNVRSGKRTPEPPTVDRIDLGTVRLNPNEVIIRRVPGQPVDIFAAADNLNRQQLEGIRAREQGRNLPPERQAISPETAPAPVEVKQPVAPESRSRLTPDAQALIDSADAGGVPAFVSQNFRRILLENGIPEDAIARYKPVELVEQLRLHGQQPITAPPAEPPRAALEPAPAAAPPELAPDQNVGRMPLRDILVDEERFQSRTHGTTKRLADVSPEQINDLSLGNLAVWRDPENGNVYVVEGHHRRQMLQNAGAQDARVQFIDAANAKEARLEGALLNMRAGTFDAVDVAGVLRESGWTPRELEAQGVELTRSQMKDGMALANLHPALWGMVKRGEMPITRAATIGRELGGTPEAQAQQLALVEALGKRRGELTDSEIAETIRQSKAAPVTTETQGGLFGEEQLTRSLMIERGQVVDALNKQLGRDKRLFKFVSDAERAQRLKEEGSHIEVDRAAEVATQSAQVGEIFARLANRQGSVSDAVNDAARAVAAGTPVSEAVNNALPQIRAAVAAELAPAARGTGLGGETPEGVAAAPSDVPEGQQGLGFDTLKNERGAIVSPSELLAQGRGYVARLAQEQADIAQARLAQHLEASRRRGRGGTPGTEKAPMTLEERVHGRKMPQEAGELSSQRPNRLTTSIGDAAGPEVEDVLNQIGLNQRTDIEFARRGVVTDRELHMRSDELAAEITARADGDPRAIAQIRQHGANFKSPEHALAMLKVNEEYARQFLERMQKAGDDPVKQLEALRSGIAAHDALLPAAHGAMGALRSVDALMQAAGGAAEAGRTLRVFRVFKEQGMTPQQQALQVAAKIFNTSPATARAKLLEFQKAAMLLRPDDTLALNQLLSHIQGAKFSDRLFKYAVNGWLSGIKGMVTDTLSNGLMVMRRPMETLAAVPFENLRAAAAGERPQLSAGEAGANLVGMYFGIPEAARRFMRTMVTQVPQSGASRIYDPGTRGAFQVDKGIISRLGNLPATTRMAIDEAFKALAEQSYLYGQAYQIPKNEGLTGQAHISAMADIIRHPERVHGLLEGMEHEAALRTWQDHDPFTESLLQTKANHPWLRWIFPFVRTPLALFRQGMRDVGQPLTTARNLVGTYMKATGRGGPTQARLLGELPQGRALSEQMARTAVTSMLAGAVMAWALEGKVTGAGPVSAEKRRELRATGWAPNSIITKDNAISYNRLDPVGLFVGTIADMAQAAKIWQVEKEDAALKIAILGATSAGNNFVNKTYMRGLADTMEAIRDPERYLPSFLNHEVSSLVPYSVATAGVARAIDPTVRQARTLKEVLQSRIPGLTANVFPLRDVFGREILVPGGFAERLGSPFDRSTIQNDPATAELRRLEYAPGSPMRNLHVAGVGVDLTPERYDKYVVESGKLAKQMVDQIVASKGYQNLPNNSAGDAQRQKIIQRAFTRAREAGRAKVLPDIMPEVTAELESERQLMGLDIEGKPAEPND